MKKILTIGIICQDSKILLGLKLRGFGTGRWNGPGGKFEEEKDKNVEESFKRETLEESMLAIGQTEKVGFIEFEFADEPGEIRETHIFHSLDYEGQPKDGEEMKWQWFDKKEIPYDNMWKADQFWLPLVLEGKKICGRFLYDSKESMNIISQNLWEVDKIK